jgi:hypothetical protein
MEEERIIEMMQALHDYIQGRLSDKEEDDLWVEFLLEPHWYNIFETELHLTHLAADNYSSKKSFEIKLFEQK